MRTFSDVVNLSERQVVLLNISCQEIQMHSEKLRPVSHNAIAQFVSFVEARDIVEHPQVHLEEKANRKSSFFGSIILVFFELYHNLSIWN